MILAGELLAIAFMGLIAAAANKTGVTLLLFPELAALSHDVLTRPQGKWASQPLRLILTPTLTAVAGLLITQHAHYGAIPMLLILLAGLAVIRLLRSSIGPALSAGMLPMVLDERHWMYPLAICIGLTGLVLLLWMWQRYGASIEVITEEPKGASIDDALEINPTGRFWLFHLLGFVLVLSVVGQWTGLRFILFPPLVVMAYEILGHPELPGWMKRPALFPLACFLTASVGVLAYRSLSGGVAGVVVTVVVSILLLRLFRIHLPPALAVGLLPFVMTAPNGWYPVSVALGTSTLSVFFRGRGWLMKWSSFLHYATGCEGRVEIESGWTARRSERASGKTLCCNETAPLKPKQGLTGPPAANLVVPQYSKPYPSSRSIL
jgi:hypothetical protein